MIQVQQITERLPDHNQGCLHDITRSFETIMIGRKPFSSGALHACRLPTMPFRVRSMLKDNVLPTRPHCLSLHLCVNVDVALPALHLGKLLSYCGLIEVLSLPRRNAWRPGQIRSPLETENCLPAFPVRELYVSFRGTLVAMTLAMTSSREGAVPGT